MSSSPQSHSSRSVIARSLFKIFSSILSGNDPSSDTSEQEAQKRYVIIGNGVAGIEAAKRVRALDKKAELLIISRESLLHWSRPALMYVFMGELTLAEATPYPQEWFDRKRIEVLQAQLISVDRARRTLYLSNDQSLSYDALLLALGGAPRRLNMSPLKRVMSLYDLDDLAHLEELSHGLQRALIIGGGLISIEWAEMLIHRGIEVHIAIREDLFAAHILLTEEASLITALLRSHGVHLHSKSEVITSSESEIEGQVDVELSGGQRLQVGLVGVAIGVQPAIDGVSGIEELCQRGLVVDEHMQTADESIFGAGDCAEMVVHLDRKPYSRISGTWYEAREMGRVAGESMVLSLADNMRETTHYKRPTYRPNLDIWYNSAKFFDVEYQEYGSTYGRELKSSALTPLSSLVADIEESVATEYIYWQDTVEPQSLRIFFKCKQVIGFAALGIRLRQSECERFIRSCFSPCHVLRELHLLRFDAEFNDTLIRVQSELLKRYTVSTPKI